VIGHKIYVYHGRNGGALYALAYIDAGERVFQLADGIDTLRILVHSDRPNCVLVGGFVIALRGLELGEEITCDQRSGSAAAAA